MTDRIRRGMVVEDKDGNRGVTVDDFMNCCADWETPVAFYGTTSFQGTPTEDLKVIGREDPVADPDKCGAGKGDRCCIFLTCGPRGFSCERHSGLRTSLIFRKDKMTAKREPVKPFPECQDLTDG